MNGPNFDHFARRPALDGLAVPGIVLALAGEDEPELVWRNELGGLTFRLGDRFLKVDWFGRRMARGNPSEAYELSLEVDATARRVPLTVSMVMDSGW